MPPVSPPAPGAPAPQQPPFGSSPATGPVPNKGFEAAGLQKLGMIVKQLEELIPMFGATSEPGKAVLDCLTKLGKLVPAGSVTPAAHKNQIESMAMKAQQANQQMQSLKQGGGAGAPPGAQAA